ncbi:MAG: signal peptidase I [Candidatus Eisenbacteria bacterium]
MHARPRRKSTLREYAEAILIAVVLTLVVRAFVVQAFRIPTGSMMDTLLVGDFLFVNKFVYGAKVPFTDFRLPGIRPPQPGDIVVFRYPGDPKRDFIKRCVAVGGQTVGLKDKIVYVDGVKVEEPYAIHTDATAYPAELSPRDNMPAVYIPEGYIFVMGDNRDNSHDSRFWGPLDLDLVKGKAMILYWSWNSERHFPRFERLFHIIR